MARIKLTAAQMMTAAMVGILRRVHAIQNARTPRYGASSNNLWQRDIDAALGEYAAAVYTNRCWQALAHNGNPTVADVGGLFDVRTITQASRKLILHQSDPDDQPFVLVFCDAPYFDLLGWVFSRDGKQQEFWADPTGQERPAYFVPQFALRPMPELLQWLDGQLVAEPVP